MNNLLEYGLFLMTVGASFLVIATSNSIFSVFWLVVAFVNAAAMFISLGLDYLGLIFIIVYVGAIAILFLFVIMLVEQTNSPQAHRDNSHLLPAGLSAIFLFSSSGILSFGSVATPEEVPRPPNILAIGEHLYTTYYDLVLISSLVLLVAMIGAILLAQQPAIPLSLRPRNVS
uniref:NADH dehydrogenase subunit 6 n=1 Tax=Tenerodus fallax TaxID=2069446 RepID=UPI001FAF8463|nr:NADH dehydrogenase subunit 6 [Tenerodus fallax]UKP88395.1 NADH dehydrogenase subunit 6 [Tenerodus fallax]